METLWFCLAAFLLTGYVILDGFDIGAGIVHRWVTRSDEERRQVLASIGPVWDGNEVWLLATGGTLYFAFPGVYASSFSGFYLPLMIVLWLLILRGIAIEFRNHFHHPVWTPLWDTVFAGASLLLAVFYGAALGNVVRGVPLDGRQEFFLPLWTDFAPGADPGILDWYTIAVGLTALAALTMHGGLWVALKTPGELSVRAAVAARAAAWATAALTLAITAMTFSLQPQVATNFELHPWGAVFPALAIAGLAGALRTRRGEVARFGFSCVYLAGMMASAAFGVFPYLLPSCAAGAGLSVHNAAAPAYGLKIGLMWWIPGMALACGYAAFLYHRFAGKVAAG